MSTVDRLIYLMHNGAELNRIRLSARAVLAKVLYRLQESDTLGLGAIRESI